MAATFDPTAIATDIISYARARFRDVAGLDGTTVTRPLFTDEEYQGFIDRAGNEAEGLAQAALAMAAVFNLKVQSYGQAQGESVTWPRRAEFYERLAADFRVWGVAGNNRNLRAGSPALPTCETDDRLALL